MLLFIWVRALPGDPARALLGERATPESIAAVNAQYGFDQPLIQQYLILPAAAAPRRLRQLARDR